MGRCWSKGTNFQLYGEYVGDLMYGMVRIVNDTILEIYLYSC